MAETRDISSVASAFSADEGSKIEKDSQPALAAHKLDYMADLVLELKQLADLAGLKTLAGILALAHAEALQQVAALKK